MANMTAQQRLDVANETMRTNIGQVSITKPVFRAVMDAIDTWANTNAASLRTAVNTAGGTTLTNAQVALMFVAVVTKRWIVGA